MSFCEKLTFSSLSVCVKNVIQRTIDSVELIFPGINMNEENVNIVKSDLKRKFKVVEL